MKHKTSDIFEICKNDFSAFVEVIIGMKNEPFHNEIDGALSNEEYRKIAISFARGHGKSSHLSIMFPLWLLAKNHNLRILLISAASSISESFLSEIMGHIEKNELYKAFAKYCDPTHQGIKPQLRTIRKATQDWSGKSITINREDLNLKDPTIHALGVFGAILSKRADVIICDDIVNQENSATEDQRKKVIDWIYTTIMPVLVPGGRFLYLGNTWHQDDLVAKLLKDPLFDFRKKMPAIVHESNHLELWNEWTQINLDESMTTEQRKEKSEQYYQQNKKLMDEGLQILWPSRFSYKELFLMRISNSYAFARMYQCDPSDRPDQKFKEEWIERAIKKGELLKLQDESRQEFDTEITTEGLDLAISLNDNADDTCKLTLDRVKYGNELYKTGDYIIRQIKRGKMTPNETRMMVKIDNGIIRPAGIRVESVAYQESMLRDIEDMGIPVHGYHTGGEKHDSDIGVNSLAILAEIGKLIIPYNQQDPRTITICSKLINEMRAFPDGHTGDSLMALWFAFSEMRDLGGKQLIFSKPVYKPEPDLKNKTFVLAEEKKADLAVSDQSIEQRASFNKLMRGRFKH